MKEDGGPAFPQSVREGAYIEYLGMSLRDYFAAHAPIETLGPQSGVSLEIMTTRAYRWADVMLKVRKR